MSTVTTEAFIIRTHHGNYRHEAIVDVPVDATDIEAWEMVQSASPYTPDTVYGDHERNHTICVRAFAFLRGRVDEAPVYYAGTDDYGVEYVNGHSWTTIYRATEETT